MQIPRMVNVRTRFLILRRDNFTCYYCGATSEDSKLHLDHVVPYSKGGTTTPSNLLTACETCNIGKYNLSAGDIRSILAVIKKRNEEFDLDSRIEKLKEKKLKTSKKHDKKPKKRIMKVKIINRIQGKVNCYKILNKLVEERGGMLLRSDAIDRGVHQEYIRQYKNENSMIEMMPGVYTHKDYTPDILFALQHRFKKGVYSYETALHLWGMADSDLMEYTMTVPRGYNNPGMKDRSIRTKFIDEDRYHVGLTTIKTSFGNEIRVYDRERTLCDLFNKRHNPDIAVLTDAFKRYAASEVKDVKKLLDYAKVFRVEEEIRTYINIFLQ